MKKKATPTNPKRPTPLASPSWFTHCDAWKQATIPATKERRDVRDGRFLPACGAWDTRRSPHAGAAVHRGTTDRAGPANGRHRMGRPGHGPPPDVGQLGGRGQPSAMSCALTRTRLIHCVGPVVPGLGACAGNGQSSGVPGAPARLRE